MVSEKVQNVVKSSRNSQLQGATNTKAQIVSRQNTNTHTHTHKTSEDIHTCGRAKCHAHTRIGYVKAPDKHKIETASQKDACR